MGKTYHESEYDYHRQCAEDDRRPWDAWLEEELDDLVEGDAKEAWNWEKWDGVPDIPF